MEKYHCFIYVYIGLFGACTISPTHIHKSLHWATFEYITLIHIIIRFFTKKNVSMKQSISIWYLNFLTASIHISLLSCVLITRKVFRKSMLISYFDTIQLTMFQYTSWYIVDVSKPRHRVFQALTTLHLATLPTSFFVISQFWWYVYM